MIDRLILRTIFGAYSISPKTVMIDFTALALIYFIPAISHLTSFPVYLIEPMRIAVIFAVLHTNKNNAIFLAISIPLFSFFISSHPVMLKSVLIIIELIINILLFSLLVKKTNIFVSMFLSILVAKIIYYALKFGLIQFNLLDGDLLSTPIIFQWLLALLLSIYAVVLSNKNELRRV